MLTRIFAEFKKNKKEYLQKTGAVISVALLYCVLFAFGITCPIKFITGISCPGCGMTRSLLSLCRLDFAKAFFYHPGFILVFVFIVLYLRRRKMSKNVYKYSILTLCVIFVIIYLIRMVFFRNNIVCFDPLEGVIFKIFRWIKSI